MKNSFIFYSSFYEALENMPDNIQLILYRTIAQYSLTDEIPELDGVAKALFALIKPQIDANSKRYADGKKGGRPKTKTSGFENTKPVVLENEKIKKPNENVNQNVNVNENENQNENENVNLNVNVNENGNENADSDQEKGKREFFHYSSDTDARITNNSGGFCYSSEPEAPITEKREGFYDTSDIKGKKESKALSYKPSELTDKDMTILENYVKRRKLVKKNIKAYVRKIILNGDHIRILEEEKMRLEMAEMQNYHSPSQKQIEAELASIHDKKSAFQVLARYYNALADYPPPLEEIAEHYKLNNSQAMADYQLELITNKTREELDKMKPFKPETRMYEKVLAKELAQEGYNKT